MNASLNDDELALILYVLGFYLGATKPGDPARLFSGEAVEKLAAELKGTYELGQQLGKAAGPKGGLGCTCSDCRISIVFPEAKTMEDLAAGLRRELWRITESGSHLCPQCAEKKFKEDGV